MQKFKHSFSTIALTTALAATLALGGCNKKDTNTKSTNIETITISNNDALQALKVMGLDTSGVGALVWAGRTGSHGNYVFTDIAPNEKDDKDLKVGTLELKNLRMDGEIAVFDQISFNNVRADNKDDKVSLKNLTLTKPSTALAGAFNEFFNGNEDAFEDLDGKVSFSAIEFTGFEASGKDGELSLASLKAGETNDGTGFFSLNDLDMDIREKRKSSENVKMTLGSVNVTGVNLDKYKGLFDLAFNEAKNGNEDANEAAFKSLMGSINPYNPDFKDFSLNNFALNADGLMVNLDSINGKVEQKNGKVYMSQTMTPLTITPPKETKNKDLLKFKDALTTLGYDALAINMQQNSVLDEKTDSMIVKDSFIALKDGFKLSFDYDMVGYKAYMENAVKDTGKAETNPMAVIGMMNKLKVNTARIALKDESFIDRAFKLAAEQQGSTPDALKLQASMSLKFLSMMAKDKGQQKIADDLSKALGSLLDEGGTLVINMAPDQPVVIGSIAEKSMQGDFDVATLGISITHEK